MKKKYSEIRFGALAIQKGFVTPEQVVDALTIQAKENLSTGEHRRIGQILLEQGLIDSPQIDEILQTLKEMRQTQKGLIQVFPWKNRQKQLIFDFFLENE